MSEWGAWDDGPTTGGWIAARLGPFGPSLGHAVPLGYAAYAVVPVPEDDELGYTPVLERLLGVLGRFTGAQPVHAAMWEGWDGRPDAPEPPSVEPLDLPERRYRVRTGPLRSASVSHDLGGPSSLIWPADRSWFVGVPIYTFDIAIAGTTAVVDAVLADRWLDAHPATPDDELRGDD